MSQGRVAVVTGGLSGIGLAAAAALQAAGAEIAIGSRAGGDAAAAAEARAALGAAALIAPLDVVDQASIDRFLEEVRNRFGPPQILVNAAGVYHEAHLAGHDPTLWRDQIDINLTGPFNMTRAMLPGMYAAGWGRVVNIASTAAHHGAAGYAAYCASKAGLVALSKVTAVEGAPHGVSCVSISPTWVETPMMDRAAARRGPEDAAAAKAALKAENPQGRLVQPEEIAALIALCCSDAAPALTNEDIQVNAGALW